jgi:Uma2 family endonuclease
MTVIAKKHWTDQELLALPKDGHDHEIINGELYMSPAGSNHGEIIGRLLTWVGHHVLTQRLGRIFDGQTGFRMKSGDLFSPDISFVTTARWKRQQKSGEVFFQFAPDLTVEVLSPGDKVGAIEEKIAQYFTNGCRMVWVVNPLNRTVLVSAASRAQRLLVAGDLLDGGNVLPAFKLPISELFEC